MKIIFSCIFLLATSCSISKVSDSEDKALLVISQLFVEPVYKFEIAQERLKLFKTKLVIKDNGSSKEKNTCLFSKKLKQEEVAKINAYLKEVAKLESKYLNPALGGIAWDIKINFQGEKRSIYIENKLVPEIFDLFNYLNTLIPPGEPKLSIENVDLTSGSVGQSP
jgi:hypothetical protein